MTRAVLAALTRTGVLWLVPFALALELAGYSDSSHLLREDWATSLEVVNTSAPLLMILAAVAGCLFGGAWHRQAGMLQTIPGRGPRVLVLPGLLVAGVLSIVHLGFVGAVLMAHRDGTAGVFDPRQLMVVLPAFTAYSLLGVALARATASRLLAPFVGVCLYAALVLAFGTDFEGLFSFGGAGVPLTGKTINVAHVLWQTGWFVALAAVAAAALVLMSSRTEQVRVGWGARGWAAAGVALLAVTAGGVSATGESVRQVATEITWVCHGAQPQLCTIQGHEQRLMDVEPRIREVFSRLDEVEGFPLRATYRERLSGSDDGSGTGQISLRGLTTDEEIGFAMLAATYLCSDEWTYQQVDDAFAAAEVVSTPRLDQESTLSVADIEPVSTWLSRLTC